LWNKIFTLMKHLFLAFLSIGAASAATVVQTKTMTFTHTLSQGNTGAPVGSIFTMSLNPFDESLGTLESFTISWVPTANATGTVGSSSVGGVGAGFGGNLSLDGASFASSSGGGSKSDIANSQVATTITVSGHNTTYLASNAGVTYNPALLAAVIGDETFDLKWDGTVSPLYSNLVAGQIDLQVIATVTYTFTAVPEPSVMLLGAASGMIFLRRRR